MYVCNMRMACAGRRYDEEGNLKQWWSAATLEHYHGKVQCIIDQYSRYHMPQLPNYTVITYIELVTYYYLYIK
jgi:predicted metalloendopeptidase